MIVEGRVEIGPHRPGGLRLVDEFALGLLWIRQEAGGQLRLAFSTAAAEARHAGCGAAPMTTHQHTREHAQALARIGDERSKPGMTRHIHNPA